MGCCFPGSRPSRNICAPQPTPIQMAEGFAAAKWLAVSQAEGFLRDLRGKQAGATTPRERLLCAARIEIHLYRLASMRASAERSDRFAARMRGTVNQDEGKDDEALLDDARAEGQQ